MKKINKYFVVLCLALLPLLFANNLFSQTKALVTNVDFYVEGDNLIITYDIEKAKTGESFIVGVSVTTKSGNKINAYSLIGDVGKGVFGGKYKRITWDLVKDNVYLDDEIQVEVFLQSEKDAKAGVVEKETKPATTTQSTAKSVSVGGAIFKSLVFPGWGNRYVKDGGAYWLMGVLAYGAAGGAVYFNNQAYNAYEDYKITEDATERDKFYTDAEDFQSKQKMLMISAAAIWTIDLIWTGIQAGNANKKARNSKMSMGYYYNPVARQPMISLSYRF